MSCAESSKGLQSRLIKSFQAGHSFVMVLYSSKSQPLAVFWGKVLGLFRTGFISSWLTLSLKNLLTQ